MTDLHATVLAPPLLARLAHKAPGLALDIVAPGPTLMDRLDGDAVDALVGLIDDVSAGIGRRTL